MLRVSVFQIMRMFFSLHPYRIILLLFLNIIRGVLPTFRSYSQALILDEVDSFLPSHWNHVTHPPSQIQLIVTSGNLDFSRLLSLCSSDIARMLAESLFDSFA